jgi:transglutaminase-like putative cysteine protease
MRFGNLYRISMYAMLILATLILSIDAGDYNRFAGLYPIFVLIAAFVAYCSVDRNPKLGLPRDLANFLAMGSVLLSVVEYWANTDALLLAMGHWLVYLQLVKIFLPKTTEDDWFLFVLALVQVLVGTFLSHSDWMGTLLFLYALLCLWNLALFHLKRENEANRPVPGVRVEPMPDPAHPYPGLFTPGFFATTALVGASTLALGALIFLLMPRWSESSTGGGGSGSSRHLTGFSDQVRLGQMGEILENDALVMTVELLDGADRPVGPNEEALYRGVTLVEYENGRWSRGQTGNEMDLAGPEVREGASAETQIRQKISLQPTDSNVLFSIRPVLGAYSRREDEVQMNSSDGTLVRRDSTGRDAEVSSRSGRRGAFNYEVVSERPDSHQILQPERSPMRDQVGKLLQVPPAVRSALQPLNQSMLGAESHADAERIARLLEAALRDSGQYTYTLQLAAPEPGLDPVVDFLTRRKQGHCEYFASALALQLRVAGIPTRMVNGFKGGEWNGLVRAYSVREKHAHSWVEALIQEPVSGRFLWITLDPTPAQEREAVVAQVGGMPRQFRTLTDAVRFIWTFYVVGFDPERQHRLIYQPVTSAARYVLKLLEQAWGLLAVLLGSLFVFRSLGDFFSVRGFLASVSLMLMAVAGFRLVQVAIGLVLRRRRARAVSAGHSAEVAFFHRLIRLLALSGLERKPAETPREFARRAASYLGSRNGSPDELATIPERVVDAFYRVRFGRYELAPATIAALASQLDHLENNLRGASSRPGRAG